MRKIPKEQHRTRIAVTLSPEVLAEIDRQRMTPKGAIERSTFIDAILKSQLVDASKP